MKLLFSHNETPSIIITMEVGDLPIELEVADALKSGHPTVTFCCTIKHIRFSRLHHGFHMKKDHSNYIPGSRSWHHFAN